MRLRPCDIIPLAALAALAGPKPAARADVPEHPNVLLVMFDDLNDWTRLSDPAAPIRIPNLQRLAARGVLFSHAYCAAPACNPSRSSMLTGIAPFSSGVYSNQADWKKALPGVVTLPNYFREHGYYSAGAGKIFHHAYNYAYQDDAAFDAFQKNPWPFDAPMPKEKLNGLKQWGNANSDWGVWPAKEEDSVDHHTADFGIDFLRRSHDRPFFLAIGFFRPHSPQFSPQKFVDAYPAGRVTMPVVPADDRDDLPSGALRLLRPSEWFYRGLIEADHGGRRYWTEYVRHYQAAASYADSQFERLLAALDASPYRRNTIIVMCSDNGFHLGEKQHIEKFALWEKTTHIPLIVVAPGVTSAGRVCASPVSLLDLYPTLLELAGLPPNPRAQGLSLVPLLRDPAAARPAPVVSTYLRNNHAVRTDRWRYIRYADGSEELYDERADPNEWTNLARRPGPEARATMAELRRFLPAENAPSIPDMPPPPGWIADKSATN